MSDSNSELCRRAQAGDAAAASELLHLHYQLIFSYLRRLSGNDTDAADLTQKTFCQVWKSLPTYQARSRFSTWLYGVGRHVYLDWRRQQQREALPADFAPVLKSPATPFSEATDRETAGQIYQLVEGLEPEAREVIHLHYYEDLSLRETADVAEVAVSTVKYRLREALAKLKNRLEKLECRTR